MEKTKELEITVFEMRKEINELKEMLQLTVLVNKDVLTIEEADLFTGYRKSYLYKLNSQDGSDLPVYSYCESGKLYFKREELEQWMTRYKKNNFAEFQKGVDGYFISKSA